MPCKYLIHGAVFSPSENKWMSRFRISNRDFVVTQRAQTAVWADSKVLVWGVGKKADVLKPDADGKIKSDNGILAITVLENQLP